MYSYTLYLFIKLAQPTRGRGRGVVSARGRGMIADNSPRKIMNPTGQSNVGSNEKETHTSTQSVQCNINLFVQLLYYNTYKSV